MLDSLRLHGDAHDPHADSGRSPAATGLNLPVWLTCSLSITVGLGIGLAGICHAMVTDDRSLGFEVCRVMGALAISLVFILVTVAGAELLAGGNLLVMTWLSGSIPPSEPARDHVIAYVANLVGATVLTALVIFSGHLEMPDGPPARLTGFSLPFVAAFLKTVLADLLIFLAVSTAIAARQAGDKVLTIIFQVSAFVVAGFEHAVANPYLGPLSRVMRDHAAIDGSQVVASLLSSCLGSLAGAVSVLAIIWGIIRRPHSTGKAGDG